MKKLLAFLFILGSIIYFSCNQGISKQDEDYIKLKIAVHQSGYGARFSIDSINYYTRFVMMNARYGEVKARHVADSLIKEIYRGRNIPYSPEFDANLTYEKFIQYCKDKHVPPRKRIELLSN